MEIDRMNAISQTSATDGRPRRRRLGRRGPDPLDVHIGARVRLRRVLLGLTQVTLAAALGLTFQQIQKYERGHNRISASMLWRIAAELDVPVAFFFDGMEDGAASPPSPAKRGEGRATLELMRHFDALPKPLRKQVCQLVKAMGALHPGVRRPHQR